MKIIEKILDWIFPPVCGLCGNIDKSFLCDNCRRKFDNVKISGLDDYSSIPVFFEEHYYEFKYEDEIRDAIIGYKFNEKSYLYKTLAKLILEAKIFREDFINKYDVIICVPVHKKRMKKRGYNQSKLIAREIAKELEIEYVDKAIVKGKNIVAQSSLDMLGRMKNIKDAFSVGPDVEKIKGKNVAIFDDVFTTGATVNECGKVLKEAGCKNLGVFTLAKD